jgi:hypothetical protein
MTSVSANVVHLGGGGPPVFTIQGELCYKHGPLLPQDGQIPHFAQVYFVTDQQALEY